MASKPVVPVTAKTTTTATTTTAAKSSSASSTTTAYSLSIEIQQQRDVVLKAKPVVKVNMTKPEVNKTIPQKEIETLPMAGFAGVDSDDKQNKTEDVNVTATTRSPHKDVNHITSVTTTTTVP